ncbi:hypothetical protein SLE2022_010030 [Rubroshorea leprosula]
MKIVTYNVNGLRQRISQFGSLLKLLISFDADIICFQETKIRRQELTADLVMAEGYESFFSCTRTSDRGRTGYSGVATFCRVKSAISSNETALPIAAEEGFTGLLAGSRAEGLEEFSREELQKIDGEGRCIITDHGHFVLFNVYGPRAGSDDEDRIQFKLDFFKILQKRWESLLHRGRRIFVVGDLNIAPSAIDRCDAGPDFEKNEFRRWFRSILVESGGHFVDVFRAIHPQRREAYTCWPSNTGAEQFNYGTRIDHILYAGSCLHQEDDLKGHNFISCHVKECDILTEYKRWKPGDAPRWKGGWNIKLEGSDHVPVYTSLVEIADVEEHSSPSLAARYLPMIHGQQQTLVSVLMKRQVWEPVKSFEASSSFLDGSSLADSCRDSGKRSLDNSNLSETNESCSPSDQDSGGGTFKQDEHSRDYTVKAVSPVTNSSVTFGGENISSVPSRETKKKARKSQQLSLRSFFRKSSNLSHSIQSSASNESMADDHSSSPEQNELNSSPASQDQDVQDNTCLQKRKNDAAILEWQRIQRLMQNSIPLCKGHKEPCVARVVKKPGPTFGHRFYVCARAEGPASNPEANCGFFRWASVKSRQK